MFKEIFQQDSQEFLSCLLDGLHEEINEIIEKPYIDMTVESRESDEVKHFWLNAYILKIIGCCKAMLGRSLQKK